MIDADAIKAINLLKISNSIITAHSKELEILLKNSNIKIKDKSDLQKNVSKNILVIKSNIDTIISNKEIHYNNTGNPGMTVGGTGDILAGLTAGFVSQGNSLIHSASAAIYLCGYIGNQLYDDLNYSFIASDFLDKIGPAIKELLKEN